MLRCPPSRVNLTSSDLTDFDRRYFARQQARSDQAQGTSIRLSPGPNRLTSVALVPEQHNEGRKRAASTLSKATICSTENGTLQCMPEASSNDASAIWTATTPSNILSRRSDQSDLCTEAANALANTLYQQSPSQPPPHTVAGWRAAPVPETLPLQHDEQRFHDQHAHPGPTDLDGSADVRLPNTPLASREDTGGPLPHPSAQRSVVGMPPYHQAPVVTPHRTLPSLLSSARARRRHARSHDIVIPEYEQSVHDAIQSRHLERVPSGEFVPGLPQPVPELILPPYDEPTVFGMTLPLEPGAAVFVPRTRFGTTTGSELSISGGLEPRWSSLDTAHSTSDLKIRSSSEQNAEQPVRYRITPGVQQGGNLQPRHQRRSRASDQNDPATNLERYPLLRPSSRPVTGRHLSGSHRPVLMPGRRASRTLVSAPHRTPSAALTGHTELSMASVPTASLASLGGINNRYPQVPSPVSASSGRSQATLQPPTSEPRVGTRSSSLAWTHTTLSPARRIPSMVSAASGISSALSSRHSSTEGLHAAAEFLRMRSSPLDDLTESLSRLAASRPRSVAHSWERSPGQRQRVSLLNGDLFRAEASPVLPDERNTTIVMSAVIPESQRNAAIPPRVADMACLPPQAGTPQVLTPARVSSSPLPSTPPVRRITSETSTPRSPLKDISPSKTSRTPRSAIIRKPLPSHATAATPRVRVYDDSVPAHMQPQTPADIGTSARRARGLSEAAVQGPTALANAVALTSSPPIPQRRSHRHTYPSTTPRPQVSHSLPGITPAGPSTASAQGPSRPPQARRRADARTHSSEENEIESQMGLLEEDRRIWERRQEAGSLESTPPGEGRFERFLVAHDIRRILETYARC
ncbi:hypothetical protein LTR02_010034 [Friedmanniomyces endolithicus]|nr:hypothetical protein LTR02_010034 [Friedmanniomyces endolithicus]